MVLGCLTGHLHYRGKGGGGICLVLGTFNPVVKILTCRLTNNHRTILFSKAARVLVPTVQLISLDLEQSVGSVWFVRVACFNAIDLQRTNHTLPMDCSK